jgi:hypothetical protein
MAKFKFRVWCNTENDYAYVWADSAPSQCPNDAGHTVDHNKTSIIQTRPEYIIDPVKGPDLKIISDDGNTTKQITLNNDGNLVIEGSEIEHNKTKYESTHIDEESTTSNNYIDYPNCLISSPKAGTYFISFSCVTRNSNANGWGYVILNGAGSDIAHTERRMQGNKESSLSTVAVVTVNGSEDIKVRIRRDSKGSAEFSNASLVAVRLGD